MAEKSNWQKLVEEKPEHSSWYIERFRTMAADGADLAGEARLIDAMAPRGARILDAGCGSGRVGSLLATLGHDVVGVDGDPALIAAAGKDHPGPTWLVGDLSELDLPARGIPEGFDVVFAAGNVMPFLAPGTRREVLARLGRHVLGEGRIIVGFGAGRDYEFEDFRSDVVEAGLSLDVELSTWDLRPFTAESDFIVAVLSVVAV